MSRHRRLIVALHGYGGTGAGIAGVLAAAADDSEGQDIRTVVVGPDGPCTPRFAREGQAWFEISSQPSVIAERSRRAAPAVAEYIARMQQRHRVPARHTGVVGFSQGASVAAMALAGSSLCERAVLACGRIPAPDTGHAGPDVLVVTGGRDRFVRHDAVRADLDSGYGRRARHIVLPELAHEFTEEVARIALAYLTSAES
ncbi:alpha/beta hydrolase [Streptomyces sp. NPDC008125]|uniref:alpha/beta hydrolase n=1 Tax=Streptomyces sp. NPDC008125 TaxID=3364811 RepID=UPI0036ECCA69